MAGLYYSHNTARPGQYITDPALGAVVSEVFGVTPSTSFLISYKGKIVDRQIAGFGEVTVVPLRHVEVTAGVRVYNLKQAIASDTEGLLGDGLVPLLRSKKAGINPKFTLNYRPNKNLTLYTTAAKGFRAGGPNGVLAGRNCTLQSVYSPSYEPDGVWNYEGGLKARAMDGKISANIAGYRIDWENLQGPVRSSCGNFIANYGSARINGAEAEMTVKVRAGLTLNASASYNDARLRTIKAGFAAGVPVREGDRIINVPRWQYALGGEYSVEIAGLGSPYLGVNFQHVSGTPSDYTRKTAVFTRSAYDNLDVNVGLTMKETTLSLFVRNATNSLQVVDINAGLNGQPLYNRSLPRTIGINVKRSF